MLFTFIQDNLDKLLELSLEHVGLTFISLTLAIMISLPAGIYITRKPRFSGPILIFTGILQTIPSIALLGFMLPLLGIGIKPAIVALLLYALLPILRNTYTGIQDVDASVKEAAKGMGMTNWQILTKVELPLAMPVIFAGIRTATVINVGVAALAAYIGAGGLGEFIFGGIALNNTNMILAGAIPAALLAIIFDQSLAFLQHMRIKKLFKATRILMLIVPLLAAFYYVPNFFHQGIRAGFDPEFMGRADGYSNLVEEYGVDFNTVLLNASLMYYALDDEYLDIIGGYATDGRIKAFNLETLEDDKHAFPPYFCAPLIRGELFRDHPEVVDALNLLKGAINDSVMQDLNYQVDFNKRDPADVSREFLETRGLWKPDSVVSGNKLFIGSKIFTEQYILAEMFGQLIDGYTTFDVDLKLGLGGTKICFDALNQDEIDIYPEYTGTGLLVLLEPEQHELDTLGGDASKVYQYVYDEFREIHDLYWLKPIGFNNTYALMMRQEDVKKRHVHTISGFVNQL